MSQVPPLVQSASNRALEAGFEYSCDDNVGRLLSVLAASVPADGRILELGTGAGVGTAWIVSGLNGRSDVEVLTIEVEPHIATNAQDTQWPTYVRFVIGDAVEMLPSLGRFDLVFADAQGGKWERLDLTIGTLRKGGFLLVDDMTPTLEWEEEQAEKQSQVRDELHGHSDLIACDIDWATGLILCVRRH